MTTYCFLLNEYNINILKSYVVKGTKIKIEKNIVQLLKKESVNNFFKSFYWDLCCFIIIVKDTVP